MLPPSGQIKSARCVLSSQYSFGVVVTSREKVLVHPLEVWQDLAYSSSIGDKVEAMFYLEWGAGAVYRCPLEHLRRPAQAAGAGSRKQVN